MAAKKKWFQIVLKKIFVIYWQKISKLHEDKKLAEITPPVFAYYA